MKTTIDREEEYPNRVSGERALAKAFFCPSNPFKPMPWKPWGAPIR